MWTPKQTAAWSETHPWIAGFNYVPAYAVNSTEMWQKETFRPDLIQQELTLAHSAGYNACRIFLPFLVWSTQKTDFLQNFDTFLTIAKENGLFTVPILFDDCAFSDLEPYPGPQRDPVKGIHNSGWTPSPGFRISDDPAMEPSLEAYVRDVISRHAEDSRILFWDLYNEVGNSGRKEKSLPLLKNAFRWARAVSPSQPLTACLWIWEDYDREALALSDIITFHDYRPLAQTREFIDPLLTDGRPLFCTEWLHRPAGNTFRTHLPYYRRNGIGVFNWGLVNGRTQTNLNWDKALNCFDGQPELWQHDVFTSDHRPYRQEELDLLKQALRLQSDTACDKV